MSHRVLPRCYLLCVDLASVTNASYPQRNCWAGCLVTIAASHRQNAS